MCTENVSVFSVCLINLMCSVEYFLSQSPSLSFWAWLLGKSRLFSVLFLSKSVSSILQDVIIHFKRSKRTRRQVTHFTEYKLRSRLYNRLYWRFKKKTNALQIHISNKHQGHHWINRGQVSVASMVYFTYFCMNFLWNSDRRVSLIKCCSWNKVKPTLKLTIFGCDIDTRDISETFL